VTAERSRGIGNPLGASDLVGATWHPGLERLDYPQPPRRG